MSHYPITITQARYGGAYEGGEWVAFHLDPRDIPEEAFADDATCVSWWLDHGAGVGRGSTPEQARENLVSNEQPLQLIRSRGERRSRLVRAPGGAEGRCTDIRLYNESLMPLVGIRELGRSLSAVVREIRETREPTVVTDRGRPVVLMVPIDEAQLEDFVLTNAPAFVAAMQAAEDELAAGQTQPLQEAIKGRKTA